MNIEKLIKRTPIFGSSLWHFYSRFINKKSFRGSARYWNDRYAIGGNSGAGSYGKLAYFKADVLNGFVQSNNIKRIIEFGCGDGNQLSLSNYPSYIGFDISPQAIKICNERFKDDCSGLIQMDTSMRDNRLSLV